MEIYFDNSATTKPLNEVVEEVVYGMKEYYGNPSSLHTLGLKSEKKLKECREALAKTINANENEIYFNSGASEGNNQIIKGILKAGSHFITTPFEHSSIANTIKKLENNGVKVTYLKIDSNGKIDLNHLKKSITKETVLVSIIHVNNEIGVIQDLRQIGKIIKENSSRAKFHVDAVQSYGKLNLDVKEMDIDYLTASSHKFHGPKGCGFIYIKKLNVLNPLIEGGEQEFGVRAGTQNIPGVMGMTVAAKIENDKLNDNYNNVYKIKKRFIEKLKSFKDIKINSLLTEEFSPYILNVSFKGVRGEVLLHFLEQENIYVSTGSACSSQNRINSGSYVLKALNLSRDEILGGIRFSFSDDNTKEEVDYVVDVLEKGLKFLRRVKR
ncbi:UNVERIFIED_ORG: cysteine desulfurase NifS [Clostridium botulinum]|uniref:cysteine desulfurase family protein n=1 Tax=Clostridium botulinum TaxID=1491 RepID=UPI000597004C|nr:cysteine desulfurase family protein [Clostridium botulinum]KIL09764.1 cysteine desulfurase [Clostridium botulinum]MBN1072013.1 cysteine desulfurase [Clostridium botulinum]MBY6933972.1 cysteine desulfurase [Clostridium botulinum]NFL84525.1 cysteine desulfurase [Clostridium botulinum]NFN10122.1 cysteine desulfurase [Clostridium botulinum]